MFTVLGKLLVLLTVACSLLFAGFAVGLVTNRINYPGVPGQPQGAEAAKEGLAAQQERIKELLVMVEGSRARWLAVRGNYEELVKQRPQVQDWYADQLSLLRTGKKVNGEAVQSPVRELVYEKGRLVRDKSNPTFRALGGVPTSKPLDFPSLAELRQQSTDVEKQTSDQIDELNTKLAEEKRLTGRIQATRVLIEEEQRAAKNSEDQRLNVLAPLLFNERVQVDTLERRQRSLKGRLEELRKLASAPQR